MIRVTIPADAACIPFVLSGGFELTVRWSWSAPDTPSDLHELLRLIAVTDLWNVPTDAGGPVPDGDRWVFELQDGHAYRAWFAGRLSQARFVI